MAIAGLSIDMGAGGSYAESAAGFTNATATKNFLLFLTRVVNYTGNGISNYPFGVYASASDYLLFHWVYSTTLTSYYPMYLEWKGGGTVRSIILRADTTSTRQVYGNGQQAMCLSRSGNDLRLKMIDFGGDSATNDPAMITNGSATLVAGHDWTALKAGKVQIQRYNTTQQGESGLGPIVMVEFSGAVTFTDADIEAALMNPSSIPDLVTARGGCSIVHQWDGLTRSGSSLKPGATGYRTALATNDVIVDSVGGVNLTYTKGSGTGHVYPDFTPVGRFVAGAGKLHNINESNGPLCVADANGGYYFTRQVTDSGSLGLRFLSHIDANGAEDRIPIPLPGAMSHCDDGSGTLTTVTGDITPTSGADAGFAGILPEYHHGVAVSFDGTRLILLPTRHSLTRLTGSGTTTHPVLANKRYNQQAEYIAVTPANIGDVDALTPTMSLLGRTLAGSGNVTLDYQRICPTHAMAARVGNYVVAQSRCSDGNTGELIIRKFSAGVETCLRVTSNGLSGSGSYPVATIPLSSNACAFLFVLRNATGSAGNGSGVRGLVCTDLATFTLGTFTNLVGTVLSAEVSHTTMQTGPDTTGTDISGFGATSADQGNGSAIGDGAGLVATVWAHGVGCNTAYSASATRYKVNIRNISVSGETSASSTTLDLTDIIEAAVPSFRSASGKGNWSVPRLAWLNSAKTRIGVFLTDPNASTMVANGGSVGGCPFVDSWGTRVLAAVITNLNTSPTATWYGTFYTVSGSILSVDIPTFAPQTEYVPFLMLQGYLGPNFAADALGICRNVPVSLATLDTFAAAVEGANTSAVAYGGETSTSIHVGL